MEPIAPVASATASRLTALGGNTLTEGQLVQARVTRVDGAQVRLQLGEQSLNATSRVALTVGQQVNLLVEQAASGKMLLRMVDDTFGKGRPARAADSAAGGSQIGGASATAAGPRQAPITPVPGRSGQRPSDSQQQSAGQGGAGAPGAGSGANAGRQALGMPAQDRPVGGLAPGANLGTGPSVRGGFVPGAPGAGQTAGTAGQTGPAGQQIGAPWMPGAFNLPSVAASASALASLLFSPLDGAPTRPAGGPAPFQQAPGQAGPTTTPNAGSPDGPQTAAPRPGQNPVADGAAGLIAKSALPTYGRLAQSVGGAVAFGQLLATHVPEVNQTLARASLAPTDLGRLLVNLGVHPDEMNAVLVGEMLAQGEAVQEGNIRGLRRELAAAGGSLRDAAPAVALARLGLPITPLSLAVARQLQAGQLAPGAAWGDLLRTLQRLTHGPMSGSQAGVLAAELLADWRVPLEEGAPGIAKWLQAAVDQAGTPLEAKLARPLTGDGVTNNPTRTSPGQDVRARLDLLAQALPNQARGARGELASTLSASLQRVQATVQGEQLLNGSTATPTERTEPRFLAVTLPTVMGQQLSTLELRVKERDARPAKPGEPARPDVVHLRLNLPGLGDLSVNLTVGQHSVACQFATSTQFAEALLTASSSELVGRLKRLGYGHTTVEAAHEPPAPTQPSLTRGPRLHQVDLRE